MYAIVLASLCTGFGEPPELAPPPRPVGYLPPNLYLVRAKTLDLIKQQGDGIDRTGLLRITDVLGGPARLMGKEFTCVISQGSVGFSGPGPGPPDGYVPRLDKDTPGVWWVYEGGPFRAVRPELRHEVASKYRILSFPYSGSKNSDSALDDRTSPRLTDGKGLQNGFEARKELRVQEEKAWVEAVSAVYAAKTEDDRRVLLERYAAAADSPVSAWALVCLASGPREPAVKFLTSLATNDKIDVDAQATLDRELCRMAPGAWVQSPVRKAMYLRWLDPKASDYTVTTGRERLNVTADEGYLGPHLLEEITKPAFDAFEQLGRWRRDQVMRLLFVQPPPDEQQESLHFDFLVRVAGKAKSWELRYDAVTAIGNIIDHREFKHHVRQTAEGTAILRKLQEAEPNEIVRKEYDRRRLLDR